MTIAVPLDWMLIGGACALVGASAMLGAVVYCLIYTITLIGHGLIRALRHRIRKETGMAREKLEKGDKVEITKGTRTGKEGTVATPGEFITHVEVPGEVGTVPVMNHELEKK